jgi:hypothetical protein
MAAPATAISIPAEGDIMATARPAAAWAEAAVPLWAEAATAAEAASAVVAAAVMAAAIEEAEAVTAAVVAGGSRAWRIPVI